MSQIIRALEDENVEDALRKVFKRAATEPEFRQLALENTEAAFEEVGHGEIEGWKVKFIEPEEVEEDVHDVIQLPPSVELSPELTEEDLDAVAGGAQEIAPVADDGCCTITDIIDCLYQTQIIGG